MSSTPGAISASTSRTGSIAYFGSGLPLGRPRCEHAVTSAPRDVNHSIVGSAARMRNGSTTLPSLIGTLKSARKRTRRPLTSPRSSSLGTLTGEELRSLAGGADDGDEIDQAVRVAVLVVVPAEH